MHDLTELIDKWINSALNFREAETIINLLIVDNSRLEKENKGLQEALVYVAHASHATPLHQLPTGITLMGNDAVEVSLNAGYKVLAKHSA